MEVKTTVKLNNGREIPQLGLGVYGAGTETKMAVRWALQAGYRHIDTASIYENEREVGEAVLHSGIPREKVFITSKLWNDDMRRNCQEEAFEKSLQNLGMEYIDLYLIHWPVENFTESWKVLERLYISGKVKSIGVSNFGKKQLDCLMESASITPAVNQIECHPLLNQEELILFCRRLHIVCESYSPFGGPESGLLSHPGLLEIAKRYEKSPAQIIIRWNIQRELVVIPKSIHQERIISNMQVYDFELTDDDMEFIDRLDEGKRFRANPDNFKF